MQSYILYPILGLKTDAAYDDPGLLQPVREGFASYCVDGRNISFNRVANATSKSFGVAEWSNAAIATPSYCLGIFELFDGTNRVVWIAYDGDMHRYASTR
ncbi:unnamed protein product, partial [marine sediment metagenome]